jgi:hypothetical protein
MATDHFDDPNIPDEERLFRRIHLTHIVEGDGGRSEVSSAAFRNTELSVNPETRGTCARLRIRQEEQEHSEIASRRRRMDRTGRGAILGGDTLAERAAWDRRQGSGSRVAIISLKRLARLNPGCRPQYKRTFFVCPARGAGMKEVGGPANWPANPAILQNVVLLEGDRDWCQVL